MIRTEEVVFKELEVLCSSPGYAHAIASFCFRDNFIGYKKNIISKDYVKMFSNSRLIRTEISTIIGLMARHEIDYRMPSIEEIDRYIQQTEALLAEIHQAMMKPWVDKLSEKDILEEDFNPFSSGIAMREPIFYGGESAYMFQYRDFAQDKYASDQDWIFSKKGFRFSYARKIIMSLSEIQRDKILFTLMECKAKPEHEWTLLPGFIFSAKELSEKSNLPIEQIENFLSSFCTPATSRNSSFQTLDSYNETNAYPILRCNNEYLLFQGYSIAEAVYETPFYWMLADKTYEHRAMQNRGRFTEDFVKKRLQSVFGHQNVYSNIDIYKSKSQKVGEIDVLVAFADRAIVVQAKSKRLTIEARKGNDNSLKSDFKKAIQEAYDQAATCATNLLDRTGRLVDISGKQINFETQISTIYIVCAVADHYPALAFQARNFLSCQSYPSVSEPLITDLFGIDAIAEMLSTPLYFLSYLDLRSRFGHKLLSTHELTNLSYHLQKNLWLNNENDMLLLHDDISSDLDIAMLARRDEIPGRKTPDGILTRLKGTRVGKIISLIENTPHPATIDLGLFLLTLDEDTANSISRGIDFILKKSKKDGEAHDITFSVGDQGITIHCNAAPIEVSGPRLERHCNFRKYSQESDVWFGLNIDPNSEKIKFGLVIKFKWEYNQKMSEKLLESAPLGAHMMEGPKFYKQSKISRNYLCPCGSGKKYKKCCLRTINR